VIIFKVVYSFIFWKCIFLIVLGTSNLFYWLYDLLFILLIILCIFYFMWRYIIGSVHFGSLTVKIVADYVTFFSFFTRKNGFADYIQENMVITIWITSAVKTRYVFLYLHPLFCSKTSFGFVVINLAPFWVLAEKMSRQNRKQDVAHSFHSQLLLLINLRYVLYFWTKKCLGVTRYYISKYRAKILSLIWAEIPALHKLHLT